MTKLRLLLWEDCNRACKGCCNQQWDLASLPVCSDFTSYDLIMLTGGEPMLYPDKVTDIIREIRSKCSCPIYMYTAKVDDLKAVYNLMFMLDGWTVTLHDNSDIDSFRLFAGFIDPYIYYKKGKKPSMRLNIFKNVDVSNIPWKHPIYTPWKIKSGIEWIEKCPLPINEEFMKWQP